MKKLLATLVAVFFSLSVAGLSFADEKKHEAAPAATGAPANPCAGKHEMKKPVKKKAAAKKTEETPAAPTPAPAQEKPEKR